MNSVLSHSLSTVITQYKRGEYASADATNPGLKKELKALLSCRISMKEKKC